MRCIAKLSVLCLVASVAGACKPDEVIPTEAVPTAGVRFINAVPDTGGAGGLDFRFVDLVEDNAQFRITFRNSPVTPSGAGGVTAATTVQYKNARAGSRHFRIFLDDTLQAAASTVLKDSTITLEAGKLYTVLLWGNARSTGADKMALKVIEESVADPGNSVALRVINTTNAAIDVRQYAKGAALPTTPTWANVGPFSISNYVTANPDTILYNVQPAGGGTNVFADARALVGQAAVTVAPGPFDAVPGTTIKGSAVTLIVFPRSVAGSRAPQSPASVYGVTGPAFVWDRRPPRPAGT